MTGQKNKLVFVLLSAFFNSLGFDRFYVGQYLVGALKLLLIALVVYFAVKLISATGKMTEKLLQDGVDVNDEKAMEEWMKQNISLTEEVSSAGISILVVGLISGIWGFIDFVLVVYNGLTKKTYCPPLFGSCKFDTKTVNSAFYATIFMLVVNFLVIPVVNASQPSTVYVNASGQKTPSKFTVTKCAVKCKLGM